MSLKRQITRRRASITSLIDVIFLLLLFFMLASTFSKFSDVEVSVAQSSTGTSAEGSQSLSLLIEPRRLIIDDQIISENEMRSVLQDLLKQDALTISIQATDECNTQRLISVFNMLGGIEGLSLVVVDPR
ncbi:MAG: biopolymer transporter ExbD [Pseudomonadota bacterium]